MYWLLAMSERSRTRLVRIGVIGAVATIIIFVLDLGVQSSALVETVQAFLLTGPIARLFYGLETALDLIAAIMFVLVTISGLAMYAERNLIDRLDHQRRHATAMAQIEEPLDGEPGRLTAEQTKARIWSMWRRSTLVALAIYVVIWLLTTVVWGAAVDNRTDLYLPAWLWVTMGTLAKVSLMASGILVAVIIADRVLVREPWPVIDADGPRLAPR